ncbi:MAG: hypothetical protein HXX17_16110, partial [Geobacteraceae bacterium]|nr:hypothetical protein [Geobacteraceae bacterium]
MLKENQSFQINLSGSVSENDVFWTLSVSDRTFSGSGSSVSALWDGKDSNGTIVQPGTYTAMLTATSNDGVCTTQAAVNIKILPPCSVRITGFSPSKTPISPQSGEETLLSGSIDSSRDVNWTIGIDTVSTSGSGYSPSLRWNGKDSSGRPVSNGNYRATLTTTSAEGDCSDQAQAFVEVVKGPELCIANHNFLSSANTLSGRLSHSQELISLNGGSIPTLITLNYDSLTPKSVPLDSELIRQFRKVLEVQTDGSVVFSELDRERTYIPTETGFQSPDNDISILIKNPDNIYQLTDEDGTINNFNADGKITSVTEISGKSYSFAYSEKSISITDPANNTTTFSQLFYNSIDPMTGVLSHGWTHSYEVALQDQGNGAILFRDGSKSRIYTLRDGIYHPQIGDSSAFVKNADNTYVITELSGLQHFFDQSGRITSRKSPNNSIMTFSYTDDRLTGITDSSGRTSLLAYNSDGKLATITDPKGNAYTFSYEGDNLATPTNPDGGRWSYSYDTDDFLIGKTDPENNSIAYSYDSFHRILSGSDPEGQSRSLSYFDSPREGGSNWGVNRDSYFVEKDGGVWTYSYDSSTGTLTSKTDPLGNSIDYTYDLKKNIININDANGYDTSYTYDDFGNRTSITDALGNVTTFTYNERGQVLTSSGPQGESSNSYDVSGNLLVAIDPSGASTTYTYDQNGNISTIKNPLNQVTTYNYNAGGLLSSISDPTGIVTTFTYDANGNRASSTTAGKTTTYGYDGMNRLTTVTDPLGNVTTYGYDKLGNRISVTDANGKVTTYRYNYRGQVIEQKDALEKITTYSYGAASCPSCGGGVDKLAALADAKGQATTWQYDQAGHMIQETDPLQNSTGFSYDPVGNLIQKTDANANVISFAYDPQNRITSKTFTDGTSVNYSYDTAGRLSSVQDASITYSYTYDAAGRVTSVTDSRGFALAYEYDLMGNRTKMTVQQGTTDNRITSYVYDNSGRLATMTTSAGLFTFGYDNLSRRSSISYPNQTAAAYSYDDLSRLTGISHSRSDNSTITSSGYTLDNIGNRIAKGGTTNETYQYDNIYRLIQAVTPRGTENFTYDEVGNRITGPGAKDTNYQHDAGNRMLKGRQYTYTYDNNGNQITRGTANASSKGWTLNWDFENRLTKMERTSGADKRTITFKYDPLGKRIEKQFIALIDGITKTTTTTYVYDGDNIVLEIFTPPSGVTEKTFYTHGAGVDEHLAMERGGQFYYFAQDGLGSVTAITDASRNVVQSYTYDSFGLGKPTTGFRNSFMYVGKQFDREAGLIEMGVRPYDPMEGRF